MNLRCRFIVIGILVTMSIAVLEGAPAKIHKSKTTAKTTKPCESKSCVSVSPPSKCCDLCESKEDTFTVPEPCSCLPPKPSASPPAKPSCISSSKQCPCQSLKPCSCPPSKPCSPNRTPKPSLSSPKQQSESSKPPEGESVKPCCHNIFSHFYGYFSWMAQFYKWVEKYGKWMASGVNHMFC